jgi:hypothetical protein
METGRDNGCKVFLDIAQLAADIPRQAWLDEKVDCYLLLVFDLPPLAGRIPLLVHVYGEAGAAQSLGESLISAFVQHGQSESDVEVHRADVRFRASGQCVLRDEK